MWVFTIQVEPSKKGVIAEKLGYFAVQDIQNFILLLFCFAYPISCLSILKKAKADNLNKEQLKFTTWIKSLVFFLAIGLILEMTAVLLGRIYGYWQSNPIDESLGFSFTMMVKAYNAIVLYAISFVAFVSYSSFRGKNNIKPLENSKFIKIIKSEMVTNKMYLDPSLSLHNFSSHLGITSGKLSEILNIGMRINFNDFVNFYRVQEVIDIVNDGKDSHLTLVAISEKAGFNSKTTFYRAFKKVTSMTPKAFFKTHLNKN